MTASHRHRAFAPLLIVPLLLVLVIQLRSVFHRAIVNDDYQLLYTAYLRSLGRIPGVDFGAYSPQPLADLLAPIVGAYRDSLTPLFAARLVACALLVTIGWLLHRLARRHFGESAAWAALTFTFVSQAMFHRGLDLRPDLVTTALWLGALDLATHPKRSRLVAALLGAALGLVFVNRFKAALVAPFAIGLFVAGPNVRARVRDLVFVVIGSALVVAAYLAFLHGTGQLGAHRAILASLGQAISGAGVAAAVRGDTLRTTVAQDPILWITAACGAALVATRAFSLEARRFAAVALALGVLSVALNPAYYAYNLVTLVPLMALLAGAAVERVATTRHGRILATAIPLTPLLTLGVTPLRLAGGDALATQRALHEFLWRNLGPNESVFALEGVGLYRPSTFHFRMPEVLRRHYETGAFRFAPELAVTKPAVVLASYRMPGWLTPDDGRFIMERYVPLASVPDIWVPGAHAEAGTTREVELLAAADFELTTAGQCTVDERALTAPSRLDAGRHVIRAASGTACTLRRHFPAAEIARLDLWQKVPFLFPPRLETP